MNEQYTGRIVMELRQDVVPMTAGNPSCFIQRSLQFLASLFYKLAQRNLDLIAYEMKRRDSTLCHMHILTNALIFVYHPVLMHYITLCDISKLLPLK